MSGSELAKKSGSGDGAGADTLEPCSPGSMHGNVLSGSLGNTGTKNDSFRKSSRSQSLLRKPSFFAPVGATIAEEETEEATSCWRMTENTTEVVSMVVKRHPFSTLGPPIATFVILTALGIMGAVLGANQEGNTSRELAAAVALDTSAAFRLSVEKTFAPLLTLESWIIEVSRLQEPDYSILLVNDPRLDDSGNYSSPFQSISDRLIKSLPPGTISNLQYSPFGVVRAEEPLAIDEDGVANSIDLNLFGTDRLRSGAIATMELGELVLVGPLFLARSDKFSAIVRKPVYVPNVAPTQTFGNSRCPDGAVTNSLVPVNEQCEGGALPVPVDLPYPNITLDMVFKETDKASGKGTKFWGFVTALVNMQDILSGKDSNLLQLEANRYNYAMTRPPSSFDPDEPFVFASSKTPPPTGKGVYHEFTVTNQNWTLVLYPESGFDPSWKGPVIAAVVVISLIIALLVFVMMVALKHQAMVVEELADTNKALEDTTTTLEVEKVRMDAMLVRQYNLIQCFSSAQAPKGPVKGKTALDRIAEMRQQLNSDSVTNLAETEQIKCVEVLGEGSFGKVYKGLWRGTAVAVKTMVLPACMTGQEKREKMAIMEAAISSTLAHPNVVATYTYSVKPVRDTFNQDTQEWMDNGVILLAGVSTMNPNMGSSHETTPSAITSISEGEMGDQVHAFEVRLVLELCDLGCLRDALDGNCFFSRGTFNYRAILDCALDISKAMSHLHYVNVLHSDLKARNVLLKASGDARGFTCKVADFGLSVKIDSKATHMSDMYQGTMTHMAPEILLDGHMSKAADVYAFGITMWELFTGGRPFDGVQRALLGHKVTKENARPVFNGVLVPRKYKELAERCWHADPSQRPNFEQIMEELVEMREAEGGLTGAVKVVMKAKVKADTDSLLLEDKRLNKASNADGVANKNDNNHSDNNDNLGSDDGFNDSDMDDKPIIIKSFRVAHPQLPSVAEGDAEPGPGEVPGERNSMECEV